MKSLGTGIALVMGIGLSTWWFASSEPKQLSAEPPVGVSTERASSEAAKASRQLPARKSVAHSRPNNTNSPPEELMSEADFIRLYRETDFTQSMPTALLVEAVENSWNSETPQFFINLLEGIADTDPNERGRLIFLANELRSPDLTGFWTKVLERSPAAFPNEAELLSAPEPNLSTMSLRNELSTALRNLGVSAFRQESARGTLQKYVRTLDPALNNTIVRKDAYYRLREANPTQAARSLSALAKDDPLRRELELN